MLKSHSSIAVESYLLENYKKLGVTDKEFVMLLHFRSITETGKSAWTTVSERMGYNTDATVTKLVNSLVEKGFIKLIGRGYDLDATKLFDACLQIAEKPETVNVVVQEKPKKSKRSSIDYQIAQSIVNQYMERANLDNLANIVKELRQKGVPDDEFLDWIGFMDSFNKSLNDKFNNPVSNGITIHKLTLNNYQRWVDYGKQKTYQAKKSNTDVL